MTDVFISYAHEDSKRAYALHKALQERNLTVWLDRKQSTPEEFGSAIDARLKEARAVVVLWSEYSTRSRWVLAEAETAANQGKLFSVLLSDVELPLGVRMIPCCDLNKEGDSAVIHRLCEFLDSGPVVFKPMPTWVRTQGAWPFVILGGFVSGFLGAAFESFVTVPGGIGELLPGAFLVITYWITLAAAIRAGYQTRPLAEFLPRALVIGVVFYISFHLTLHGFRGLELTEDRLLFLAIMTVPSAVIGSAIALFVRRRANRASLARR